MRRSCGRAAARALIDLRTMAPRAQPLRRDDQPAFVLHTYAYRETSVIVEAITADYGRVAMVARGARRPRSELRGLLQGFQPLLLSWSGQHELKTLLRAEWRGGLAAGRRVGAAVRLLPQRAAAEAPAARGSASAPLRRPTRRRLPSLPRAASRRPCCAASSSLLLAELGYALPLVREADTGDADRSGGAIPLCVRPRCRAHRMRRAGRCDGPSSAVQRFSRSLADRYPDVAHRRRSETTDAGPSSTITSSGAENFPEPACRPRPAGAGRGRRSIMTRTAPR